MSRVAKFVSHNGTFLSIAALDFHSNRKERRLTVYIEAMEKCPTLDGASFCKSFINYYILSFQFPTDRSATLLNYIFLRTFWLTMKLKCPEY